MANSSFFGFLAASETASFSNSLLLIVCLSLGCERDIIGNPSHEESRGF